MNAREYRRGNQKWTIQINWQHRVHKTKKTNQKRNPIFVGHHYTQTNKNNVNKIWAIGKQLEVMTNRTSFL